MKTILFLSIFSIFLVSCAPKGNAESQAEVVQNTGPVTQNTTTSVAAEKRLQELGISIFPEAQALPTIVAATLEGKNIDIKDYKGKYVFLNFWATWCPPCREEMPSMEVLYKELKGEKFDILAISVGESPETVRAFLKTNPYTFPIALDPSGSLGSIFASRGIPTTYIINPEGKAIGGVIGGREWDTPEAMAIFKALVD